MLWSLAHTHTHTHTHSCTPTWNPKKWNYMYAIKILNPSIMAVKIYLQLFYLCEIVNWIYLIIMILNLDHQKKEVDKNNLSCRYGLALNPLPLICHHDVCSVYYSFMEGLKHQWHVLWFSEEDCCLPGLLQYTQLEGFSSHDARIWVEN